MTQTAIKNNTTSLEGEIVKPSKSSTIPKRELTYKQKKFVKYYKETGNGVKSALKAGYGNGKYNVAATSSSTLLKNPKILSILNDSVEEAEGVIRGLMRSRDEDIALKASKEVLDRTVGKPIQRSESVHVNITVESMLDNNTE